MNIERELDRKPEYISGNEEELTVAFKELSATEKSRLDAIMSDINVGLRPETTEGYTVFRIKDIWDHRGLFERVVGKRGLWLHFPPALPNGSHVIELWVEGELTDRQKSLVKNVYGSLIS